MRGRECDDEGGDNWLGPGSDYDCETCMQRAPLIEDGASLWCGACGDWVCEYDSVDYDRVTLGEASQMEGRGHGIRRGERPCGSTIGSTGGMSNEGKRKWGRLRSMDRKGRSGPTRQKLEAILLVESLAPTDAHYSMALDLLNIGWPDKNAKRVMKAAREKPIWAAGHPCGVGSSAAACLHASAIRMGFDSKLSDWVSKCLPGKKYGLKYSFRALKRLDVILGESAKQVNPPDSVAESILSRAELGSTQYGCIVPRVWECWKMNSQTEGSLASHPRPVLAALCHMVAMEEGLRVEKSLIAERFNVGLGYVKWKSKLTLC